MLQHATQRRVVQVVSPPPLASASVHPTGMRAPAVAPAPAPALVRPSSHKALRDEAAASRQRMIATRPQSAAPTSVVRRTPQDSPPTVPTGQQPSASVAVLRPQAVRSDVEAWGGRPMTLRISSSEPALRSQPQVVDIREPARARRRPPKQRGEKQHNDEDEDEECALTVYDYHTNLKRPVCPPRLAMRLGARPPVPGAKLGARVTPHEYGRRLLASQSTWVSQIPSDLDWFCSVIAVAPPPRGRRDPVLG